VTVRAGSKLGQKRTSKDSKELPFSGLEGRCRPPRPLCRAALTKSRRRAQPAPKLTSPPISRVRWGFGRRRARIRCNDFEKNPASRRARPFASGLPTSSLRTAGSGRSPSRPEPRGTRALRGAASNASLRPCLRSDD
jgi:hypothetical protein